MQWLQRFAWSTLWSIVLQLIPQQQTGLSRTADGSCPAISNRYWNTIWNQRSCQHRSQIADPFCSFTSFGTSGGTFMIFRSMRQANLPLATTSSMWSNRFLEFSFFSSRWLRMISNSNLLPLSSSASILQPSRRSSSLTNLVPTLHGGQQRLQQYVVQIAQHWFKSGSSRWAISFPQVWHPTCTCVAEHWNPSLATTHSLHLSFVSSSDALRSEEALTSFLPRPLREVEAGGSAFFFSTTTAVLPWIFSWTLIGSKPKMFLALRSSSSLGSRFSSGWDLRQSSMMLVKAASRTAVVISLRHWMQVSFLLLTRSVRHPPQNRWLQGWMATGIDMISKQKGQVIWSLIDCAKLLAALSCSFFFSASASRFFLASSSSFSLSFSFSAFAFSSSSFLFCSSFLAATTSSLKPMVSRVGTLLAVSSQISLECTNSTSLFLPIFLSPRKVPLVLRSFSVILSPVLLRVQCFPLRRLSLMQITHSAFLPTRISDWVRVQVGRGWVLARGMRLPQASAESSSIVYVFFRDIQSNIQLSMVDPALKYDQICLTSHSNAPLQNGLKSISIFHISIGSLCLL